MAYYVTRHDSMAQATNTYAAVDTATDGSTPGKVTIPTSYRRVSKIISVVTIDGAHTVDTGNAISLKLSGPGMVDGDQELVLGGLAAQETGTSVGNTYDARPAQIKYTNILVKPGNDVYLSAAYNGTDPGTLFLSVTLELNP